MSMVIQEKTRWSGTALLMLPDMKANKVRAGRFDEGVSPKLKAAFRPT